MSDLYTAARPNGHEVCAVLEELRLADRMPVLRFDMQVHTAQSLLIR